MFTSLDVFQSAQSMARHAAKQQAVVARNIAHANTPGFKAMTLEPQSANATALAMRTPAQSGRSAHFAMATPGADPSSHKTVIDREAQISPNGNSVSIETEMLKSIDAERRHKRAMTVYRSAMTILRTSIGR
jgi:flagellar basal-body rod protein FlgB